MLHPTARPYLLELHPDRGYASIAMVSYDMLSGVLDGMEVGAPWLALNWTVKYAERIHIVSR